MMLMMIMMIQIYDNDDALLVMFVFLNFLFSFSLSTFLTIVSPIVPSSHILESILRSLETLGTSDVKVIPNGLSVLRLFPNNHLPNGILASSTSTEASYSKS